MNLVAISLNGWILLNLLVKVEPPFDKAAWCSPGFFGLQTQPTSDTKIRSLIAWKHVGDLDRVYDYRGLFE